jgi:DNA polymerase elongation subunit (family B)
MNGEVLDFKGIAKIPRRIDFLDKKKYAEINKEITKNKDLLFLTSSIHEENIQPAKYKKSKYKIILFGILEDGRKMSLMLEGIKPYFEIRIPDNKEPVQFARNLIQELTMESKEEEEKFREITGKKYMREFWKIEPTEYEIVSGRPFRFFTETACNYARIYFDKSSHRKDAIEYAKHFYETAHDDPDNYYRVVARDYLLTLTGWISISNYIYKNGSDVVKGPILIADITSIRTAVDLDSRLRKEWTLTMCWDIETYNFDDDGELPRPLDKNGKQNWRHKMFMIGVTFQWAHSDDQIMRICIVDKPSSPHPDFLTIVCESEHDIIRAFAYCVSRMRPEIIMGFNDSDYDWDWLVNRAVAYKGAGKLLCDAFSMLKKDYTDESLTNKNNYKFIKIKIAADRDAMGHNLQLPGCLPVDIKIPFMQLYPISEKYSLAFFLLCNQLGGKEDLPYVRLFQIYKNSLEADTPQNRDDMSLVAKYCVIDAQRCHDLAKKRSVIQDKREISNISYTSLFDAFYRANGVKVRNLTIARGQLVNLKLSNLSEEFGESAKYPGAWVFPPIKGLVTSKLSIPERIEKAKAGYKEYEEWIERSEDEIKTILDDCGRFPDAGINPVAKSLMEEPTGRPVTGLDFSSLYPSIIMAYNLSPEYIIEDKKFAEYIAGLTDADGTPVHNLYKIKFEYNGRIIRGWAIGHDNHLDSAKPDYKFGLFPAILKELFDTRSQIKKSLKYWGDKKEQMELNRGTDKWNEAEYENINFEYGVLDTKQRAVKVFMNTFYGETGNKLSPMFMLQISGGITSAGRRNIKLAYETVCGLECKVYYGDTDSLYISMPEFLFKELDKEYYGGRISKIHYWEEMVRITYKYVAYIQKQVNNKFVEENKNSFLKMAYEEVLFPVLFAAKKKYVGVEHKNEPNFSGETPLLIKGFELVKRGVSNFLKKISSEVLNEIFSHKNYLTLAELVEQKIKKIYNCHYPFEDFIMSITYKPNKENPSVQTFYKRMIAERNIHLKPYERFEYIVAEKYPYLYSLRGKKTALQVGEKMELVEIAKEEGIKIDMDYYMKNSMNGQLARFVTYNFHVEIQDYDDDAEIKKAEVKIYNMAKKYIDGLCKTYYKKYYDEGPELQKKFRHTAGLILKELENTYKTRVIFIIKKGLGEEIDEKYIEKVTERIHKDVEKYCVEYGRKYIKSKYPGLTRKGLEDLYKLYCDRRNGIHTLVRNKYDERRRALDYHLKRCLSSMTEHFSRFNKLLKSSDETILINDIIEVVREEETGKLIELLESIYIYIFSNFKTYYEIKSTADYISEIRGSKKKIYTLNAEFIKGLGEEALTMEL